MGLMMIRLASAPVTGTILLTLSAPLVSAQLMLTVDETTETLVISGNNDIKLVENPGPGTLFVQLVRWGRASDFTEQDIIELPDGILETTTPYDYATFTISSTGDHELRIAWPESSPVDQIITGTGTPASYGSASEDGKLALEAADRNYSVADASGIYRDLIIDSPTAVLDTLILNLTAKIEIQNKSGGVSLYDFKPFYRFTDRFINSAELPSRRHLQAVRSPHNAFTTTDGDMLLELLNGVWGFDVEIDPGVVRSYEVDLEFDAEIEDFAHFEVHNAADGDQFVSPLMFSYTIPDGPLGTPTVEDPMRFTLVQTAPSNLFSVRDIVQFSADTEEWTANHMPERPDFATRYELRGPYVFYDAPLSGETMHAQDVSFEVGDSRVVLISSKEISMTRSINACVADLNLSGNVDLTDFFIFAEEFDRSDCSFETPCRFDFDNDGDVDLGDFGVFASQFGRTDCVP